MFVVLVMAALLASACQPIQPPPADDALDPKTVLAIEAAIRHTMAEEHVPGVAIGIVKHDKLIYTKGFGVSDPTSNRAVTPQTIFQWSSIAKTVTATAIMQLVEQGKLDLDAPVTQYLPYFRLADERYKAITIRHLLSHTSGLPEYDDMNLSYWQ
ncbi:MAG TPA: serine hydrolase domain-containing protein, partial [Caldilineaceae bacterium]|nr:serine hydrolase domain-containing protein [Caldilineaceae bacterium]